MWAAGVGGNYKPQEDRGGDLCLQSSFPLAEEREVQVTNSNMKQNEKKCCVRKIIGGKQNLNLTG
jgi:hypothetical protein